MNNDEMPEMFLSEGQFNIIKIGVKKVPPQTPIIPEKCRWINQYLKQMFGYMIWLCGWVFVENLVNNNKAESTKNTPAENLNQNGSSLMKPPANVVEREVVINEKKIFCQNIHSK